MDRYRLLSAFIGYTETKVEANLLAGRHFAAYWLREFYCWHHCAYDIVGLKRGVTMLIPESHPKYTCFVHDLWTVMNKSSGEDFSDSINAWYQKYCNLVAQLFDNERVLTGDIAIRPGTMFYTIEEYIPPKPVCRDKLFEPIKFLSRNERGYMVVDHQAIQQARGENYTLIGR